MTTNSFIDFCYYRHDVICNQKYDDQHPYSFHLKSVVEEAKKWRVIIGEKQTTNHYVPDVILASAAGHDLIEDARVTYNDIVQKIGGPIGKQIAEVIFACTESKGRNRDERHDDNYYKFLASNKVAIFVKLCDIMSNVKYSVFTNSSMLDKYRKEYVKVKEHLYRGSMKPMWTVLDNLLSLEEEKWNRCELTSWSMEIK